MERFHLSMSHFSIHGVVATIASPDRMWRFMLIGVAIVTTMLSAAGFLSYLWASHSAPAIPTIKKDRNAVTSEEINATLGLYVAKEARYKALLERRPKAPNLGGGGGVEADASSLPPDSTATPGTVDIPQ